MALNLETSETKILYLPLKDETLPNQKPHTTLTPPEHGKLHDIKSNTFDVCTGITKHRYPRAFLAQILRTLKPGGILMLQIAKEIDIRHDLSRAAFTDISGKSQHQITHWTAIKPKTTKPTINEQKSSQSQKTPSKPIITRYR